MTRDGRVPEDNPFKSSYVYSYGHRNPQGLAWNDAGDLFVVEHGQIGRDEINLIRPGANYGWPLHSPATLGPRPVPPLAGTELLIAALAARGLYAFDPASAVLKLVFTSGDRLRHVLPDGPDLYVITTNRSPRAQGPSKGDRLLRLSPKR